MFNYTQVYAEALKIPIKEMDRKEFLNLYTRRATLYYVKGAEFNEKEVFGEQFCSEKLTMVEVSALPKNAPVELELFATKTGDLNEYLTLSGLDHTKIGSSHDWS